MTIEHSWIQKYHPFYLHRICKGCGEEQRGFWAENEYGRIFKAGPEYTDECDQVWKHGFPKDQWTFDEEHWPGAWVTDFFPTIIENESVYGGKEKAMESFTKKPLPVSGPVERWKSWMVPSPE